MQILPHVAGTLFASLALGSLVAASDLKIDGQVSANKAIGTNVTIDLTGNPGLPTLLAVDINSGPSTVFGESIALGLTPSVLVFPGATTDALGLASSTMQTPNSPALVGQTFFVVGAIFDPADSNGIDFSNGASLTLTLGGPNQMELAGHPMTLRPFFEKVRAVNLGDRVSVSIDPLAVPSLAGQTVDVYVTASQDAAGWLASPALVDLSGSGVNTVTFTASGVQANTFLIDPGLLAGPTGTDLGANYDMVIDVNQDGLLDDNDYIDGYGDQAGFSVVRDTTQAGPLAVTEVLYSGGTWLKQDLYYPTNIANMGKLPVVVVSHGNGHNYQWYDHIGMHLASYGYIVMSHSNNTSPGIQSASQSTLLNTDYLLLNLGSIAGGALVGHTQKGGITWLGHSRGAEGVARAYDKLLDGTFTPQRYKAADISLISSIAPTDFLGTNSSNPHGANYHLWVGQSDSDVSGCASNNVVQSFHLLDRAENQSQSISLKGVGHAWFHNGTGNNWATGPCQIGKANTHLIVKGYLLPLVEYHIRDSYAARDFLTRQYESFHPISAPVGDPCVGVNLQFKDGKENGNFVIDDFQTNTGTGLASSGATVTFSVSGLTEGLMDDSNNNFTDGSGNAFNGFTQGRNTDTTRGIVFSAPMGNDRDLTYDIQVANADWSAFDSLAFRACQVTRSGLTTQFLGDSTFEVELVDGNGNTSVLSILAGGAGLPEPYQRTTCGVGVGWGNEFETIRLPLEGFTVDDTSFDLSNVDKLVFRFGPSHGTNGGKYGFDDIVLTSN